MPIQNPLQIAGIASYHLETPKIYFSGTVFLDDYIIAMFTVFHLFIRIIFAKMNIHKNGYITYYIRMRPNWVKRILVMYNTVQDDWYNFQY